MIRITPFLPSHPPARPWLSPLTGLHSDFNITGDNSTLFSGIYATGAHAPGPKRSCTRIPIDGHLGLGYSPIMAQLKKLSVRHDQIIDWLIANPHLTLGACAAHFEVTQPWLSSIIHSDLFQSKLRERQDDVFGEVALSVKDRLTTLAHESLKRMAEKVVVENDLDKLVSASEVALKALGFGNSGGNGGNNRTEVTVNVVDRQVLAEARKKMEGHTAAQLEHKEPARIPQTIEQAEGISE